MDSYIELTEALAAEYRKKRRLPVIGITGSVGKTTVKEMIAQILSMKYCVHKSEESCNGNDAAVRNTLSIKQQHQVCVFELGIDDFGQMERMANCCRPTVPILTGISEVHLEKLKTMDAVYEEKSHIFDTLPAGGKIIANGDDVRLMQYLYADSRIPNQNILTYGLSEQCMLRAEQIVPMGLFGSRFSLTGRGFLEEPLEAEIMLPGIHMVQDAVCAVLIGILFGVPAQQITEGLKSMPAMKQRCQKRQENGITVIDDTYNASPVSMRAALELLQQVDGRKVCILGDMNELGSEEKYFHEQIGTWAASAADEAVFIGKMAEAMYHGAVSQDSEIKASWYPDKEMFLAERQKHIRTGDTILIKASHRQEFSVLAESLLAAETADSAGNRTLGKMAEHVTEKG